MCVDCGLCPHRRVVGLPVPYLERRYDVREEGPCVVVATKKKVVGVSEPETGKLVMTSST
eukprot:scaffold17792_cov146-Amphora_coffeaeformis.AAC.2